MSARAAVPAAPFAAGPLINFSHTGSEARVEATSELVDILLEGLDEFGRRWADQFKKPINFMEPLLTTFSDSSCFIYNKLDTTEDTAEKTFQFRKILFRKPKAARKRHGCNDEDSDDDFRGHDSHKC